jgi:hypothetical protein
MCQGNVADDAVGLIGLVNIGAEEMVTIDQPARMIIRIAGKAGAVAIAVAFSRLLSCCCSERGES